MKIPDPARDTFSWPQIARLWPIALEGIKEVRRRDGVRAAPRHTAVDIIALLFRERFRRVRLFHGCRPVEVDGYYREGVRRHGLFVLDRARRVFRAHGVPDKDIETAIADTDLHVDEGRVFLVLDGDELIEHGGHYLIYGSEGVMAVAASLQRLGYADAQDVLRMIGCPALLTCDVSLALLQDYSIREIAESCYEEYGICRGRRPRRPGPRNHTVIVHADIPAAAVRGHTIPSEIADWHRGGSRYRVVG
jgi:hypothetical protein